jgi:hypothetical protein
LAAGMPSVPGDGRCPRLHRATLTRC